MRTLGSYFRVLIAIVLIGALAASTKWWLPYILSINGFVNTNANTISTWTSIIQILLWSVSIVLFFHQFLKGKGKMNLELNENSTTSNQIVEVTGTQAHTSTVNSSTDEHKLTEEILQARQTLRLSMTDLATLYYKQKITDIDANLFPENISVLSKSNFLSNEPIELREVEKSIQWISEEPSTPNPASQLDMVSILKSYSITKNLYNGFLYRILDINNEKMLFCPGNYFGFLNTCEYLSYELTEAVVRNPFTHDILKEQRKKDYDKVVALLEPLVPVRASTDPFDFHSRHTAFGTSTLIVIKRSYKPALFLLNTRSNQLSETPGLTHVIPAGTFQPNFQDDRFHEAEFSLSENVFREFAEELIDDHHLRGDPNSTFTRSDAFSEKVKNFRREIVDSGNFGLFYLGLVIDPINLKPEILTVLILHEGYIKSVCGINFETSWETEGTLNFYEFTKANIQRVISKSCLVPTGKAHLWLVEKHFDFLSTKMNHV